MKRVWLPQKASCRAPPQGVMESWPQAAQPLAPSDLWGKERRPRNSRSSEKPTDT